MTERVPAPAETTLRDPVRDAARAAAVRALASHQGIIQSLSVHSRREIVGMDAGPTREVGAPRSGR
jgi:hypothetical protein